MTVKQLQEYFINIHLLQELPHLIIIDELSSFFQGQNPYDKADLYKTLTLISDAAQYCSSVMQGSGEIHCGTILIGESLESDTGQLHRKMETFVTWIPLVLYIQGQHSPFTLTVKLINKQEDPLQRKATFIFEANQFYLSEIE